MRVCSPHCGLDPETVSGGETYERELLTHLGRIGMVSDLILARHQRVPGALPNAVVHRLAMGRGLRWPVAALVFPPAVARVYRATPYATIDTDARTVRRKMANSLERKLIAQLPQC